MARLRSKGVYDLSNCILWCLICRKSSVDESLSLEAHAQSLEDLIWHIPEHPFPLLSVSNARYKVLRANDIVWVETRLGLYLIYHALGIFKILPSTLVEVSEELWVKLNIISWL